MTMTAKGGRECFYLFRCRGRRGNQEGREKEEGFAGIQPGDEELASWVTRHLDEPPRLGCLVNFD
jgi:hypothetical protein